MYLLYHSPLAVIGKVLPGETVGVGYGLRVWYWWIDTLIKVGLKGSLVRFEHDGFLEQRIEWGYFILLFPT